MANINISEVHLLNVPLENDYKHTLYFGETDNGSQHDYFYSKKLFSCTDFTYQRKDHIIRVPYHYDDLYKVNYVMYKNKNKWFYAFVTEVEYVNEGTSYLHIETDVLQTWYYDYEVKASFVEREHVKSDKIGEHTQPEGLETGEYVVNHYQKEGEVTKLKCVMASTVFPFDESEIYGKTMNGMFSGMGYFVCDHLNQDQDNQLKSEMQLAIESVVDSSGPEAIQAVFMAPEFLVNDKTGIMVNRSTEIKKYEVTVDKYYNASGLNGYTPHNKKLYTYPYKFLKVSNGNSVEVPLMYEHFSHYEEFYDDSGKFIADDCHFYVRGALSPGCSIRLVPHWYKGIAYNESEGINAGKLPICNWSCDLFTNWMTQNGVNVATSMIGSVVGATSSQNPVGVVNSGLEIANTIRQVKNADMQPPQTYGNINNGDVITSSYNNTFHYYDMSIKKEYAEIIDSFFDMFGYKVNQVKVPNKNHRPKYWYTKTIDVNIDGKLPQSDLEKIKKCYNTGITFWKNPSEIQDYSVAKDNTV